MIDGVEKYDSLRPHGRSGLKWREHPYYFDPIGLRPHGRSGLKSDDRMIEDIAFDVSAHTGGVD